MVGNRAMELATQAFAVTASEVKGAEIVPGKKDRCPEPIRKFTNLADLKGSGLFDRKK